MLLVALVLAGSASAAEAPSTVGTEEGGTSLPVAPAPEAAPAPPVVQGPEGQVPEEVAKSVPVAPAPESPAAPAPEQAPPVVQGPAEPTPIVPVPAAPDPTPTPPVAQLTEEPSKNGSGDSAHEGTTEVPLSPAISDPNGALHPTELRAGVASEASGETPGAVSGTAGGPPTLGPSGGAPATFDAGPVSVGAAAHLTASQRAGGLGCELAAFGGRTSDNCAVGWLGTKRFLPESPTAAATAAVASMVAAATGSPAAVRHGGSAIDNPPVSPGPDPAPSGASGASTGVSGLALSGFLTLAGLLLMMAPRGMRRLRLVCQPWRTACFVLIPERPG